MSELAANLTARIQKALPGAQVSINDPDGAHLSAVVNSSLFAGKTRIQQHRMVYAALEGAFEDELHALQLTTRAE